MNFHLLHDIITVIQLERKLDMHSGTIVRVLRERKGMTQEELAEIVGYAHKSSINKIETGRNDIPKNKLLAFAQALGVHPNDLLPGEPASPDDTQEWEGKYNHNGVLAQRCRILDEVSGAFGAGADRLLDNFDQLNASGKKKAVEALEDLAAIDKYRKDG